MNNRLVSFVALFGLFNLAGTAAWSLDCSDIVRWQAEGMSVAQMTAKVAAEGGDTSLVHTCLAAMVAPEPEAAEAIPADVTRGAAGSAPARKESAKKTTATRAPARSLSIAPAAPSPPLSATPRPAKPVYVEPSGSEQYTDHGVNGMVLTAQDAQSTFSIDVDTASYAISRRKLEEGSLPPPGAVRVEEFVNAFDYAYAQPRDGAPFAVHLEGAPHPLDASRHILRVGVQGRAMQGPRKPVHLTFLVDVSGSMHSADKLPLAQTALHHLVENLGPEDTVALATYAGSERVVLEPTPTTRKSRIHDAIDGLTSGGGTSMGTGMELAYRLASDAYLPGSENRVIVLSDGDANIGRSTHDQILASIADYAGKGITLTTVGLGMGNYKDTLMEQLANKGDGNYFYLDSPDEAKKVFGRDLSGTIETIARDVKIQVEMDPEVVRAYRLIGYENRDIADEDFRRDAVDAGEMGSGHQVTALYELILADGAEAKDALATVRMRAKKPGPDTPAREYSWTVPVEAVGHDFDEATRDLRMAWSVATFAEKLRASQFVEEVSYRQVYAEAAAVAGDDPQHAELLRLIAKAAELSGEGRIARR